jgi:hypothetical protein
MSDKVLKALKVIDDLSKKLDALAEAGVKASTNANSHLEFGTEGAKMISQIIVAMQKKGAKGDIIKDYKNEDISKAGKEIAECKKRLAESGAEINRIYKQSEVLAKMLDSQDNELTKLSKDKDVAKNPAAIKLLVESRQKISKLSMDIKMAFSPWGAGQLKFLDITPDTKVADLNSKLPMAFQASMKEWEAQGGKFDAGKRAFRKMDFADGMKLAAKLAV